MNKVALIFPGQGAQKVGMGKEFYDTNPAAKAIFDKAENILKNNFLNVIFNGPQETLTSTAYCQPAILTFSIAALKAFENHPKFKSIEPKFAAGLSLGEYGALIASGALSFEDGLRLVERRSALMEEACLPAGRATKSTEGKMAAIIGFPKERLKEICSQTGAEIANYNSPEQIVITGQADNVEAACDIIKTEGAKNVVMLDVSGAFHSSLMRPAAEKFEKELVKTTIRAPRFAVLSNVNAVPETNPSEIQRNLAKQITSSVRWEETVKTIAKQGVATFFEIGPGTVLKGLIRKIDSSLKVHNIQKPEDIENLPL